MTDLSSLSDADLMGMLQQPQAQSPLASMSDADLMKALQQPAQANSGYGGTTGAANLATMKEGFAPEGGMGSKIANQGVLQSFLDTGKALAAIPQYIQSPITEAVRNYGGSAISAADQALRQGAVNIYGEDRVPLALTPEEAANKAEMAGNALAPRGASPIGVRRAAATPTIAKTIEAGSNAYKSPEVAAVSFKEGTGEDIANIVASDLRRARLNERVAPQTHAIVDDLKQPVNGPVHTLEDIQTTRQLLGDVAGNFSNPTEQKAASQAITTLDKLRETLPQSRVLTGDIAQANRTLAAGRADYAAGKTAERVAEKIKNAELKSASAHSGGNLQNSMRQSLRPILTSKKQGRGLTDAELATIESNVRAPVSANVLRGVGKVFGGGGGLGLLHGGAVGGYIGGPLGAVGVPAAAYGVRKIGDALAMRRANKIVEQILSRSPSAQSAAPVPLSPLRLPSSVLGGLLSSSSPRALFPVLPGQLPAYANRDQERQRRGR